MEAQGETYDVGDVVYFINAKDESVIPALITEVIIRRRLNAETRASYVASVATRSGVREIEINPTDIQLFAKLDDIRAFMIEKTTQKIDTIILTAKKSREILVPVSKEAIEEESARVVLLPDGTKARLKI